jgi:hypothetical protein
MKRIAFILALLILLAPGYALALDPLEFAFAPQFGYNLFIGRMGELASPDIAYGVDFAYGILPWLALDFDVLYSEHQEVNSEEIGHLQLNHLQTGIGPRFYYNNRIAVPYGTLGFGGNFFRWENRVTERMDESDGHGIALYLTTGVDFWIADNATLGIGAKTAVARSDFEFETNKNGLEKISNYFLLTGLVRLTLIF